MPETLMPYEFHVTVRAEQNDVEEFKKTCLAIGTRAIVLDLGINNGGILSDHMTSSTRQYETDEQAFEEVERLAEGLQQEGFDVIRRKIESAPWHDAAPQVEGDVMPDGSYFESHLAIRCKPEDIPRLRQGISDTADELPLHLSRNTFKQLEDGKVIIMTTLRDYKSCYEVFAKKVDASVQRVGELGYNLDKPAIIEFALYDSNTHQDNAWMTR